MAILIKGIDLPEGSDNMLEFTVFGDGKVLLTGKSMKIRNDGKLHYVSTNPEKFFDAVTVPEDDPADNYWDFEDRFWDDGFAPAAGV